MIQRTCLTKLFILILLFSYNASYGQGGWIQAGADIDGEAAGDNAGASVSLSANGNIIAIGAPYNAAGGNGRGQVRVFQKTSSGWTQKGSDIDGATDNEAFGKAVSLDSAGVTVAIGGPYNDAGLGGFSNAGYVKIFKWSGTAWVQKGSDLLADSMGDNFGAAISLSSDGNTVAIGAPGSAGGGTGKGRVKVFRWNGSSWAQLGSNLNGETDYDVSGVAVSIDKTGNTVAIGAPFNAGGGTDAGHARVYTWGGSSWAQLGSDIDGDTAGDYSGWSVSLSGDGRSVAVGAPQDFINGGNGYAKVYTWNGTAWAQKGSNVSSPFEWDQFGSALMLSSDANNLVISAYGNIPGYEPGRAEVYTWNSSNWQFKGDTLKGEADNDRFGDAVSISYDGKYVAVGATANSGNGMFSGSVRVFNLCTSSTSSITVSACGTQYTSPSTKYTWTTGGTYKDTISNSMGCDSIITVQLTLNSYPVVNLGTDTIRCGGSVLLNAGNAGATYLWNNSASTQTLSASISGSYSVRVTKNGCVGRDTIVVTIKSPSTKNIAVSACGAQYTSPSTKYTWTTSGTYNDTIPNAVGCDSVITVQLTLNSYPVVNLGADTANCKSVTLDAGNAGASYLWSNGATTQTISAATSGSYHVKVTKNGCAGNDTIHVTIKSSSSSSIAVSACGTQYTSPSTKYTWTSNGTYKDTVPNASGCDSVITVQLTLNPFPVVNLGPDKTSCGSATIDAGNAGATYQWNNTATTQKVTLDTSGIYVVEVTKNGCSSTDTIQVTVNPFPVVDIGSADTTLSCVDSLVLDAGNDGMAIWSTLDTAQTLAIKTSGFYSVAVIKNGCATFDNINVHMTSSSSSTIQVSFCGAQYVSPSTKYTWTTSGTYMDTLLNAVGCDSVITVELTINPYPVVSLGTDTACCGGSVLLDAGNAGALYLWNSGDTTQTISVNTSGNYRVSVNKNGCIASDTILVKINAPTSSTVTSTICATEYVSPSTKYTWTTDGTYIDTIPNVAGCDSVITFQLTFKTPVIVSLGNDITHSCDSVTLDAGNTGASYLWSTGKTTQTIRIGQSGTYYVKVTQNGCSSYDTLVANLTILNLNVIVSGNTFTSGDTTATYKWLDCNNNMLPVSGGNNRSFRIPGCIGDTYNLAVELSKNGCIDTSVCKVIDVDGWVQKGADFKGYWGATVSLSPDGKVMAIGSPKGANGYVKVWKWNGTTWVQKGDSINGKMDYDHFGSSISLSSDGNTLAVGAESSDKNGESSGSARVFQWNGTAWTQVGNDLDGEAINDQFGTSISLSSNGSVLAIGAIGPIGIGGISGYVKIYEWSSSGWVPKGITLNGEVSDENFGNSVDLSSNGNTVVIGAPFKNQLSGQVKAYQWNGTAWVQKGNAFDGKKTGSMLGLSVAVSSDGNIMAVGSPSLYYAGVEPASVEIYQWNGTAWMQKGADLTATGRVGVSVALSSDGNVVVLGTPNVSENVHAYQWDGTKWVNRGVPISGTSDQDYAGGCLDLSADGSILAMGAPDGSYVKVYESCFNPNVGVDEVTANAGHVDYPMIIYPNPSTGLFTIKTIGSASLDRVEIYNVMGQLVQSIDSGKHMNETTIDLSHAPVGIYFVKVTSGNVQKTMKILLER